MSTTPAARPLWRRSAVVAPVLGALLLGGMAASTTFVGAGDAVVAADTAVEFADLNYEDVIVPSLTDRAVPVAELVTQILADPDATGEELGRREGEGKPYSYPVSATGTVVEGLFGEVGLQVEGMPEGIDVGVAIPPLGSSTALRDAGAELTFGDFVNQTEYQNVAIELNKLAAADVYGDLDLTTMIGSEISVVGGTTWVSKTGGEVTHVTIVPVSIEVGS
ncbi:DUF2291 family protein [Serinibacter arcticus]|uniref:Putative erythritol ABC transporter 2, hypothetical lipoprotein n=1 Tax=Serinibacter arcticus TaxID=1655435 RepID=A0A4Z1E5D3_9MICO|nr:DUF2291 family protein [Serinibacter arcticus]TGO06510.1 putative erythritol ABC transporter 2, hypothetical lipoprotein [Serinibacter arcticus]